MKNNQSGRSMIEMLGVLAIIGVLSVGGIAGYTKAMMKYKINKATDQISQVVASTRTLFGSQGSYDVGGGDFMTILKKAHVIPDEMVGTDDAVTNPWDGGFDVSSAGKKAADDNKAFTITLTGLPEQACMELATYDWGSGSSSGLIAIGIAADDDDDTDTGALSGALYGDCTTADANPVCAADMPMSVATAAGVCEGESNTLVMKFF